MELESLTFPGKMTDVVRNPGTTEVTETWEAESEDGLGAQGSENSSCRGKEIDVGRNPQDPETTEAN